MNTRRHFLSETLRKDHITYIVHQMKMYSIDIKECARLIFENAIFYHRAALYYAKLSKAISSMTYSITEPREKKKFMFHLLNICKEEYKNHMRNKKIFRLHEKKKKQILEDKKNIDKHMITGMEKRDSDLKRRANGLGIFIGELFKLRSFPKKIFWNFVGNLMSPTANCEFYKDFLCHFLLSDGKFNSKIEIKKLRFILNYFEYMCSKYQNEYQSKVWSTVNKVIGMKKQWIAKKKKISLRKKRMLAQQVILDKICEIIRKTTEHNLDQTSEQVNDSILTGKKSLHGIVDYMFVKGVTNSFPDNIFAHLCAISEVSIECLSHLMSRVAGNNEKKSKQSMLQLRTIIKKGETKFTIEIQDTLWNLLELLKSLDKSENTGFLGQTSSVKFKKQKKSKKLPSTTNNSSIRSTFCKETNIMNPNPTHKTVTAIDNLNIYIIPSIHGNLQSENIFLVGEQLKWTIKFMFETLIDDPNSVALNVNMCCKLGQQIGNFNSCLIEFCQREFECHRFQASVYQRYDMHLQTILNTERDAIKQKEYCSMLEKSIEKESRRSIAVVNFICELYRSRLIPEQVIEYCLITLLSPEIISEVSLTCVRCILMKFDKSLRVPVNIFERLHQVFNVLSYELLNRYTLRIRWMIDDTVNLMIFTKQINSQLMSSNGINLPMILHDQQHMPTTIISKEKDELLKRLRKLQMINNIGNAEINKDDLNAYTERDNIRKDPNNPKNYTATNDEDTSELKINESLDNLRNEEAVKEIEVIQQLIKEVNTDHENAIKWAREIDKITNKQKSDRLITELLFELKRNISVVANRLQHEDITSLLKEIELEAYFKKREELKNLLLERLDAPHNAIGNVKLFAELYNIGLLDYEEMIKIMNNFLESESINYLTIECFCEFMARIGSKLDNEYHCQFNYFVEKLKRISRNGALNLNNRIQCIIENCLNNNFYQNL